MPMETLRAATWLAGIDKQVTLQSEATLINNSVKIEIRAENTSGTRAVPVLTAKLWT
jgi:hypothetical protein